MASSPIELGSISSHWIFCHSTAHLPASSLRGGFKDQGETTPVADLFSAIYGGYNSIYI